MNILNCIILCIIFCTAPAGVLWICKKVPFFGKIGPVLLLYILGVILGNIGIRPEGMSSLQDILSSAMVPLAIPMIFAACSMPFIAMLDCPCATHCQLCPPAP